MIWTTWRQFRTQALVGGVGLAAIAIYLLVVGLRIRETYDASIAFGLDSTREAVQNRYGDQLTMIGLLVLAVPAVIGTFWGAPLVARELESGTHRLAWSQSVSRTRWLAVKVGIVVLAAAAMTGALSALLTWAASPYDRLVDDRFLPMNFAARNLAPLGYGVFAVVAGIAIGLLVRRTVVAMAITIAVFAALQYLMPAVIRPHLQTPVTATMALDDTHVDGFRADRDGVWVSGFTVPGAWVLTDGGRLLDSTGQPVTRAQTDVCFAGDEPERALNCLTEQGFRVESTYLPASAYWPVQWLEFAIYLALSALLGGFSFWWIRRS